MHTFSGFLITPSTHPELPILLILRSRHMEKMNNLSLFLKKSRYL